MQNHCVSNSRGFSLIEMIIAITALGILAASAALFLRGPITSYFDTWRRANMADAGELAIAKLQQDISSAAPNSAVVAGATTLTVQVAGAPVIHQCVLPSGRLERTAGGQTDVLATSLTDCRMVVYPPVASRPQLVALTLNFGNAEGDRLNLYQSFCVGRLPWP